MSYTLLNLPQTSRNNENKFNNNEIIYDLHGEHEKIKNYLSNNFDSYNEYQPIQPSKVNPQYLEIKQNPQYSPPMAQPQPVQQKAGLIPGNAWWVIALSIATPVMTIIILILVIILVVRKH